ncbi:MAG: hypothetical protein LBV74_13185 [Tannerella sp.]|jgi:hypothetical protein|nr:hypothetical protein [Tannerella sp.]
MRFKTKLLFLLVFLAYFTVAVQAQVTIGSGIEPMRGALLDLKVNQSAGTISSVDDDANITSGKGDGGMLLPRVKLVNVKTLEPFIPVDDPEFVNNTNSLKERLAGLIVYNLNNDDDKELYFGLNQWDGEKWNGLQSKPSNALFDIGCASVQVVGQYGDNVALNSSNYIRVSVTVKRIGAYSISTSFTPGNTLGDNGYFFELAGTFHSTGTFMVTISGTGQPKKHTQGTNLLDPSDDTPDQLILTSSGGGADCGVSLNVRSTAARPEFLINCAATVVEGMYFEDQPLSNTPNPVNNQSHRIKVTLTGIPSSAYGAVGVLQTNEVDGFSFKGEAALSSSTQEIYLQGTGIPRGLNDKIFTITSNSETSNASCNATVHMLIPRKRLMVLGEDDGLDAAYGYSPARNTDRNPKNSFNTLLTDKDNFGYNQWSILKFAGFNNAGAGRDANIIPHTPDTWPDDNRDIIGLEMPAWRNMSPETLESYLKGTNGHRKADVFMIAYTGSQGADYADYLRNGNSEDQARCQKLIDFVKTGGILMICSEQSVSNGNFMRLLFGYSSIGSANGAGAGSNYTLGYNSYNTPTDMRPYYCNDADPILMGPFDNLLGRNWGEDASVTTYVTGLPLDEIIIYSGSRPMNETTGRDEGRGVTIFRHREYPFVFVGDGGFNSSEQRYYQNAASSFCPFQLAPKTINGRIYPNYPNFRINFPDSGKRVYNTAFTANAFAWCILQAEEYRRAHK